MIRAALSLAAIALCAIAGCAIDWTVPDPSPSGGGAGAGGTGAGGHAAASSSGASSSTTGVGGAPSCDGSGDCTTCVLCTQQGRCLAAVNACNQDPDCSPIYDSIPSMATGPRVADRASGGLSPAWFFVGAGITVLAGGLTIASGVDVRNREADFYRAPTEQKALDGQSAETRTYVLGGITGAAGLATAALGIFAVSWTQGPLVRIGAADRGAGASLRWSF